MARPLPRPGRPAGVTLLEILVAVSVLAIGLGTVFQVFPMGFAASSLSKSKTIAYELAARKLEDVRASALFGGITGGSAADRYRYWGNPNAPNPDPVATDYRMVNTNGLFKAFSSTSNPEKNFFYRVECAPVVDPALRFAREQAYQGGGFTTMWRIVVTVRGPLQTVAEAQEAVWSENTLLRKGAAEAKLATYVANKRLGYAVLATNLLAHPTGGVNNPRSVLIQAPAGGYPSPENFTVFYLTGLRLADSLIEVADTGPFEVLDRYGGPAAGVTFGLNQLGLDNVVLYHETDTGGGTYVAESNKIIAIYEPGAPRPAHVTASSTFWALELLNPVGFRDQDYSTRAGLLDRTFNDSTVVAGDPGASVLGLPTTTGHPANPAATVRYYPATSTRVQTLVRLTRP